MRIELEQNHSHLAYAGETGTDSDAENRAAEAANYLREGIRAAQSGNRAAARTALLRAAELDPQSESAWLWLSSISEYPEELLAFLTNVLEINPRNARALEWSAATKSLLAKNFVQRGIDAAESNQKEMAAQHFNQALEYDEKNSMAWLWLASLSDSNEGKLSYLEKVLEFDPENETARTGYETAKNSVREKLLTEARAAAVNGNAQAANELLDAVIAEEPDAEDAWVLKSHIAVGFEQKIAAFKRILEINPEHAGAKAGLESLTSIMDAVAVTKPAEETIETAEQAVPDFGPDADFAQHLDSLKADFQQETADDPDDVETLWSNIEGKRGETSGVDQSSEDLPTASPFDNFADDTPETFDGTIFAQMPEAVDIHETAVDENFEEAASEETFQANQDAQVEESGEPEEITYELAPDTADEVNASEEFVNGSEEPASFSSENVTEAWSAEQTEPGFSEVPAIVAPTSNPFDSEAFKNDSDQYKTVVSADIDAETLASVQNFNPSVPTGENGSDADKGFNVPFDVTRYTGVIPMPTAGFEQLTPAAPTGFETRLAERDETERTVASTVPCSFCNVENDVQAIACHGCLAVLTLADLELILANHHADKPTLRLAAERMEQEKASRELTEAELTTLGIAHLNLRNLQQGYEYLHEASQKNPNNVVLSAQVNTLLIRLDEIKQQDAAHETMAKGKTILVVDDSPTVRKLIAGKLEKCGHQVFCSADGIEAMVRLEEVKPDLVLLDITMPRMDGYQVCKLIRSNAATKDVPVVMISGKDGFFDKVRGRMAGTTGYITKPFGPETLMKAVESYLKPDA